MTSSESPYDNIPPPKPPCPLEDETKSSKECANEVTGKRGAGAEPAQPAQVKKQRVKEGATVLFALNRIKQAMKGRPPYTKLCKATGLLKKLVKGGVAGFTPEERGKLLECISCALDVFAALDVDYTLRSDLGSAFEGLFDSITKAKEIEGSVGLNKCAELSTVVIKIERADESFVFAKLVKFALNSLQSDLENGTLKEKDDSAHSYVAPPHLLRSIYIAVAAKGLRKRKRYQWAKQPVDQFFNQLRKNLDIFTTEQYQRTTDLVDAMLKHDSKPVTSSALQSFDTHPLQKGAK